MINCGTALPARPHQLKLDSDDLIESLDDKRKLLRRRATELRANALNGKSPNLADLDPRAFLELWRFQFVSKRKSRALRLAGQRNRNDGTGTLVEHVVA